MNRKDWKEDWIDAKGVARYFERFNLNLDPDYVLALRRRGVLKAIDVGTANAHRWVFSRLKFPSMKKAIEKHLKEFGL